MDAFVGEIRPFAFNSAPEGWAPCNGQVLPIKGNELVFSVISFLYGGNLKTTFALPNLQGLTLVGPGSGIVGYYSLGKGGGAPWVVLNTSQIPAHTHTFNTLCTSDPEKAPVEEVSIPTNKSYLSNVYEVPPPTTKRMGNFYTTTVPGAALNDSAITPCGAGAAHPNMQPYLVMNYCICMTGDIAPRP